MKNKEFDSVGMMREIRRKLSLLYTDPHLEEKELEKIRTKYGIHS